MSRQKLSFKERKSVVESRRNAKQLKDEQWLKRQEILTNADSLRKRLTFLNDLAVNLWYTANAHTFSPTILSAEGKTPEELLVVYQNVFDKLSIIRSLGIATKNLIVKTDDLTKAVKSMDKNSVNEKDLLILMDEVVPSLQEISEWFSKCVVSFAIFKDDLDIIKEKVGEYFYNNLNFIIGEAEKQIEGVESTDGLTVCDLGNEFLAKMMKDKVTSEVVNTMIDDAGKEEITEEECNNSSEASTSDEQTVTEIEKPTEVTLNATDTNTSENAVTVETGAIVTPNN